MEQAGYAVTVHPLLELGGIGMEECLEPKFGWIAPQTNEAGLEHTMIQYLAVEREVLPPIWPPRQGPGFSVRISATAIPARLASHGLPQSLNCANWAWSGRSRSWSTALVVLSDL